MGNAPKVRSAVSIAKQVMVDTRHVSVAIEGVDLTKIPGSFTVHLMKDGRRIASSFLFQPAEPDQVESIVANRLARFDFHLPIEAVENGKLSVVIELADTSQGGGTVSPEQIGHPVLSVQLMLTSE